MNTNGRLGGWKNDSRGVGAALLMAFAVTLASLHAAAAPQARVNLGTLEGFAVLAGPSISSTSGGTIMGDLGVSPGSTFTPGTPAVTVIGTIHLADGVSLQAQTDLTTAYNDAAGRTLPTLLAGGALGGLTLPPGLYKDDGAPASLGLTGTLTLDAQGDPNAVWIFQSDSTLIAEVNARVVLINGAQACNVFWVVGSSATLRTDVVFKGNIMALAAVTLETLASLEGRVLARTAGVTLDNNAVTVPCGPALLSSVPSNTSVSCDAIPPPANVLAGNACSTQSIAAALTETVLPGSCANVYTLRRVWTATSPCGISATVTQLIAVTEATAPILLGVPANTSASCDAVPAPLPVTFVSACSTQEVSASLSQTVVPGSCPTTYTLRRVWTAVSPCGTSSSATQLIAVADSTAPVLVGVPADSIAACDAIPPAATVTATDTCSTGTIAVVHVEAVDAGGSDTNFTLRRVWTATDSCGNSTSATQVITVSCATLPPCGPLTIPPGLYRTVQEGHLIIPVPIAISNTGSAAAGYIVTATFAGTTDVVPWIVMTPAAGSIPGFATVTTEVGFADSSTNLPVGVYPVTVTVESLCGAGVPLTFDLILRVGPDQTVINDLDGDGSSDLVVYQPEIGGWFTIWSSCQNRENYLFGWSAAIPVPGDYDGDGRGDLAVYWPEGGTWYIYTQLGAVTTVSWGWEDAVPVAADYDGDGTTDIAVYWPEGGTWFIRYSSGGSAIVNFGWAAAKPVPGDYDGDGRADLAVYYPLTGTWYIMASTAGFQTLDFGFSAAVPVSGDFDGDGRDDLAVYYAPTGAWFINGSTSGFRTQLFGFAGTVPVSGDYDGDGTADLVVYHPLTGTWYILASSQGFRTLQFGSMTSIPTAGNPRPGN